MNPLDPIKSGNPIGQYLPHYIIGRLTIGRLTIGRLTIGRLTPRRKVTGIAKAACDRLAGDKTG